MAVIDQRDQRVEVQTNLVIQQVVPMLSPQDRDNRRRMLARVEGEATQRLEESLAATAWIELALERRPEAVPDRQVEITREHHRSDAIPPSVTTVADAFDVLDGELLILGEPGAGKTTMLLDLARVLIERAEEDESFPMPVVFHLASWAARRAPLEEWLVGELASPAYGVPLKLAQSWVDGDQILPLLDGLDEVAAEQRAACVAAINAFRTRRTQRLARIVVCCRRAAYEVLPPLELRGAIFVQPLSEQQVDAYLADAGERVNGLRTALQEDASLRELATTPLMLNLMVVAYRGESASTLLASESPGERRGQLLTAYVQRMFTRRGAKPPYSPERTIHWLACLARGLSDRSQTIFYLESLQQDWLQRLLIRRWFGLLTRVVVALTIGVAPALVGGLGALIIFGQVFGQAFGWSLTWQLAWQSRAWWYLAWMFVDDFVLLAVLLLGLPYALAYVVVTNLMSLGLRRSAAGEAGGGWNRLRLMATHRMVLGLGGGLAGGLVGGMVGGIACGLLITPTERNYGMAGMLMVGLFLGLIFGPTYGLAVGLLDVGSDRLAHFRVLRWSPRKALRSAWRGVVVGLATAVFIRYAVWTLTTLISGQPGLWLGFDYHLEATSGLLGGVFGGLLGGITYRPIETRSTPNQGIRRAALRALLVGSVCGLFFGVIAGQGPARFGSEQAGPVAGQLLGLFVGVGVGVAGGIASGMAHGGEACVAHLLMRLILWRAGMLPLRSVRFLDYATERVLLRRVGGGYMFVHRLLQEHFAAHEQELVARLRRDGPTAQRRRSADPAGTEAAPEAA